jgi:hypothetical protein
MAGFSALYCYTAVVIGQELGTNAEIIAAIRQRVTSLGTEDEWRFYQGPRSWLLSRSALTVGGLPTDFYLDSAAAQGSQW